MSFDQRTTYERALEERMEETIARTPTWGPLIVRTRKRLENGFYDQEIVDVIGQSPRRYSLVDAYIFLRIWCAEWMCGNIGSTSVSAGKPGPDVAIARNQQTLNDNLHEYFQADVDPGRGGSANDDGTLSWDRPIVLTRTFGGIPPERKSVPWICAVGALPLEIGTTSMARTFGHLFMDDGVARWPYGHKNITILRLYENHARNPGLRRQVPLSDDGIDASGLDALLARTR